MGEQVDTEEANSNAPGDDSPDEPSREYKYYVLTVLTLGYVLNFVDRQILSVLQEDIKAELGLSDTQLGALGGLPFAFFYVTVGIVIARYADLGVRRTIVAWAVAVWSLMTSLTGFGQSFVHLVLLRIGVGVGEAGGSPPSHSMISDLFKPEERGRALAIYSSGVTWGVAMAYILGGWVSANYGWRSVFFVLGAPGLILAFVIRFTIREPVRGLYDGGKEVSAPPPTLEVIKLLLSRKSFVHLSIAAGLHAFFGYGIGQFLVSYYLRTFSIPLADKQIVTLPLGIMIGVGGALGAYIGGYLADRLGKKDKRWYLWIPGISTLAAMPFAAGAFLTDDLELSLKLYFLPLVFGYMYLGPTLAMTHGLVSSRMRALASAVLFFVINLIGLGLGPLALGLLSDAFEPTYGPLSLRYAMVSLLFAYMWCAAHYFMAARTLREDLARAPT